MARRRSDQGLRGDSDDERTLEGIYVDKKVTICLFMGEGVKERPNFDPSPERIIVQLTRDK